MSFRSLIALSGVEDNLKALNEKLERVMRRLDYMEALLTESRRAHGVTS